MKPAASSALPLPGSVFAVPLADGRWGLARVLALDGTEAALLAVSPWIGTEKELAGALQDPRARQVLQLTHHDWKGEPQILWVTGSPPDTWRKLGMLPSDADDVKNTSTYGNWDSAEMQPLEQWRWDNEREKMMREDQGKKHAKVRLSRLRAGRREKKPETLASLSRKRWFRTWEPALGTPAKKLILDAIGDLAAGQQPKDLEAALAGIRGCVEALNRLNLERGGNAFGQTERGDLVEALLRMGVAAGIEQAAVESVVDASRNW